MVSSRRMGWLLRDRDDLHRIAMSEFFRSWSIFVLILVILALAVVALAFAGSHFVDAVALVSEGQYQGAFLQGVLVAAITAAGLLACAVPGVVIWFLHRAYKERDRMEAERMLRRPER